MNKLIQLKVILYAIIKKVKKLFNPNYDPYFSLENNFDLSPSNIILENYKKPALKLTFSKKYRQFLLKIRNFEIDK